MISGAGTGECLHSWAMSTGFVLFASVDDVDAPRIEATLRSSSALTRGRVTAVDASPVGHRPDGRLVPARASPTTATPTAPRRSWPSSRRATSAAGRPAGHCGSTRSRSASTASWPRPSAGASPVPPRRPRPRHPRRHARPGGPRPRGAGRPARRLRRRSRRPRARTGRRATRRPLGRPDAGRASAGSTARPPTQSAGTGDMVAALYPGFLERYGDQLDAGLDRRPPAGPWPTPGPGGGAGAGPARSSHGDLRLDNLLIGTAARRAVDRRLADPGAGHRHDRRELLPRRQPVGRRAPARSRTDLVRVVPRPAAWPPASRATAGTGAGRTTATAPGTACSWPSAPPCSWPAPTAVTACSSATSPATCSTPSTSRPSTCWTTT